MITFKQFITESRSAPLYHATQFQGLKGIVKHQHIKPTTWQESSKLYGKKSTDKPAVVHGVSTTRSLAFAKKWGDFILVMNQNKISRRYKITPFQYWQASGSARVAHLDNEYEEFIITKKPIPFSYVDKIYLTKGAVEISTKDSFHSNMYAEVIDKIRQQYGSSFIVTL